MTAGDLIPSGRIREAGDSALILELGPAEPDAADGFDLRLNAFAIQIAAVIRGKRLSGVRDVVPTFRSVAVYFDPLAANAAAVAAALNEGRTASRPEESGRIVEVPVVYGGADGPDLADVATFARATEEAVIALHTSRTYRVCMLGFLPGFPYLAPVDDRIAAPRRSTPRMRVAAGSVGIAGWQTGIYPRESPGGWQIIGRTPLELFDAANTPPALLAPGDSVRFVPIERPDAIPVRLKPDTTYVSATYDSAGRHITILRPGLLTTIQDSGRWGFQHLGVPVSGAMDPNAHRLANALVGNPREAATLEATVLGPEVRFEQTTRVAVAGADLGPTLDGQPIPANTAVGCAPGSVLRFGDRRAGARAYLAVDGGVAVPPVLGSRSTHVWSRLGGIEGRALRAGDRLPLGAPPARPARVAARADDFRVPARVRLRIVAGPQIEHFQPSALDALRRTRFVISAQSDRMGYRLSGGTLLATRTAGRMISDATLAGAVQVPPSGEPILLMADRQTTGGYPQIAVVITADLPLAAQLAPGDSVEFDLCGRSDAIAALARQEGAFDAGR